MFEIRSKSLIWFVAGVLLFCLCIVVVPVNAVNNVIESPGVGATIYIGEQGLDLTHALNQAQGHNPVDDVPPLKIVGWWPPGQAPSLYAPTRTIDVALNYNNFMVAPADYYGIVNGKIAFVTGTTSPINIDTMNLD
jgi:hypothetical protein